MPLERVERAAPEPGPDEVLVRVEVCGVCRTDLHVVEGELAPQLAEVVPGHQVVGRVEHCGAVVRDVRVGDRVGIAWLQRACGVCRFCARGDENLCLAPRFTGWHVDGGYAELAVAPAAFVYPIPEALPAREVAPLLCAGIIGYRALVRASLPPGGRLGIYGFGASAHLAAQVAMAQGATVHVMTRSADARRHALELGVASAGSATAAPPEPLDAAILFAPAGELVPVALSALDRGGTLALAGIYLSDIPSLDYQRHLFQERQVRSVTANTRAEGDDFLALAANLGISVRTRAYPLDRADAALRDLAHDSFTGAAVLLA